MEGRVCHKFKVPDRNGRLSLTLATETSKTDEGITTEMYREDNTEVEIHASSLETFVQTDKPIYKPGETGRLNTIRPCKINVPVCFLSCADLSFKKWC